MLSGCSKSIMLGRRFAEFNGAYFGGTLPKYEIYLCKHAARFLPQAYGQCLSRQKRILIRQSLSPKEMRETLVHEMIHIRTPHHGSKFQKECVRLRKLNAPLADWDTVPGYKPPSLTERNAQILIEDALVDKLPMRSIRRYLEQEFYRPISEIEQKIDLKRLFARMKKQRITELALVNRMKKQHKRLLEEQLMKLEAK